MASIDHQLTNHGSILGSDEASGTSECGRLSLAVAKAIARAEGVSMTDPSFRLYDSVDPDAIDALFDHRRDDDGTAWELTFESREYTVTVRSDGSIAIDGK